MIIRKYTRLLFFTIFILMLPASLFARDLAIEQFSVSAARKDYDQAQVRYEDLSRKINEQEKRLTQEQARLKELQLEQMSAKEKLSTSKIDLDKKLKALETAWDNKNK